MAEKAKSQATGSCEASSSTQSSWADQVEKEAQMDDLAHKDVAKPADLMTKEAIPTPTKPNQKPMSSWASVVQGNRVAEEGWKLEYVKPTGKDNAVKITQEEWDFRTELLEGDSCWVCSWHESKM